MSTAADIIARFAAQTLPGVQAQVLAQITADNAQKNASLLVDWHTEANNFLANWGRVGYTDPATAPKPPASWVVIEAPDATTGPGTLGPYGGAVVQWPSAEQSGPPIAPPLALPPLTPQQTPAQAAGFGGHGPTTAATTIDSQFTQATPIYGTQTAADGSGWVRIA